MGGLLVGFTFNDGNLLRGVGALSLTQGTRNISLQVKRQNSHRYTASDDKRKLKQKN